MALSETVRHQADSIMSRFCERRVPLTIRDQVRMHHEFQQNYVFLFEDRPRWDKSEEWTHLPIAKFRFNHDHGKWSLYWMDRKSKWHIYDMVKPTHDLGKLLKEVDRDPSGIFFG